MIFSDLSRVNSIHAVAVDLQVFHIHGITKACISRYLVSKDITRSPNS